jgi:hypothetical protein
VNFLEKFRYYKYKIFIRIIKQIASHHFCFCGWLFPVLHLFFDFYRYETMSRRTLCLPLIAVFICFLFPSSGRSQSNDTAATKTPGDKIALVRALMCEDIKDLVPQNSTTVFSIERRKAICFTSFDPVPEKSVIYHQWYHRDQKSAKIKLTLKPPRWSTYSSIQFRAEDIGPWRVEIIDSQGQILDALRFSITE